MIKHVVMIKLQEFEEKEKEGNAQKIKDDLDALPAKIPEIKFYETGINISESPNAFDVVLISEFDSLAALKTYSAHQEHQKVLDFIKFVADDIKVVDYEL